MQQYKTKLQNLFHSFLLKIGISEETISILSKQWKIIRVPLFLALAWGLILNYYYTPAKDDSDNITLYFVKNIIAALFFIMWFVGQFQRTSKEIRDSTNYQSIQTSLGEIRSAISQLKQITIPSASQIATTVRNQLFVEAKKVVNEGHVLAGLMLAGVAYEKAILDKAASLDMYRDNRTTISYILRKLSGLYEEGTEAELYALWQLRNKLAHLTDEAADELKNTPELINYFEWGISKLEQKI